MELNRKIQVHMLPTEDKTGIFGLISNGTEILQCSIISKIRVPGKSLSNGYHLYFTIDEEIKEEHWCIDTVTKSIYQLHKFTANDLRKRSLKIIATTDTRLGVTDFRVSPVYNFIALPQPSQAFIEKYCEAGGIDEVLIEYEEYDNGMSALDISDDCPYNYPTRLKVNSHNEITIHPIKDSWNREELIGNGTNGLDNFLMNSVIYTQEQRELVMQVIYEWTEESL